MDTKVCTMCGIERTRDQFYARKGSKDGLWARCKPCRAKVDKDRQKKLSELKKTGSLDARQSESQARRSEYLKTWRLENKEKLKAQIGAWRVVNKPRESERIRKWAEENRHKRAANEAKRRFAQRNATPSWADPDAIAKIYAEAQRISCEAGIEHHVDHIVPLESKIVCGLHCESNLCVMVGSDNISKGNRRWPDMP